MGEDAIGERVAVLETCRDSHEKRLDGHEAAIGRITGIAWAILGAVALQTIVTVIVLVSRRVFG